MGRVRDGGGALRLVVAVCFEACLAILGLLLLGLRSKERKKRDAQTLFDAVCFTRRMPMSDRKKWTHENAGKYCSVALCFFGCCMEVWCAVNRCSSRCAAQKNKLYRLTAHAHHATPQHTTSRFLQGGACCVGICLEITSYGAAK